ncbi:segregation and condensation protein A [Longimicrobium sp.]|uniref:segregation and condensation protein A n=1 Tax=Longimicrobium sp. TaxID=2029185 RepID=UPI003B3A044D
MEAPALQAGPFDIDVERFHGPLDLLLHLIRNQDIDIFDIPISKITQQFLEAIRSLQRLELERAGEFLEMAATLVRIKAQMLFPRRGDDDEAADPRADLVRRLLEYEHFREAARLLERAERERSRIYARGFVEARPAPRLADLPLETTWDEVQVAMGALVERLNAPETIHHVRGREIKMDDKIHEILQALQLARRVEFAQIVAPWGTRLHAVATLLASLELAKRSMVRVRQASPFASLWIYRAKQEREAA